MWSRFRVIAAVALLCPQYAMALEQPNGAPIPSEMGCDSGNPTGLPAVFACQCLTAGVCNIGGVCPSPADCPDGMNGTCETTLWHAFNDNTCIPSQLSGLDPGVDASVTPETFQPTCALTFTVVSRGTAIFGDAFGWYNVTGAKPALDDLHIMLDCDDAPGSQAVLDLNSEADYLGGEVGFFIVTPERDGACANGNCCASIDRIAAGDGFVYYSERSHNPDAAGPDSFIHLVIYDSQITEQKFYFAWEDIFGGSNNDFTDLVTSVEGVECSGGGQSCDTGVPGVCSFGISACRGNRIECDPLYDGGAELCDALDNDCDGTVDESATCPDADELCHNGRCVPNCEVVHEFDCPASTICDPETGRCFDPDCIDVECPADTVCRAGECVTPCDGLVCPVGQACRFGECVDPCKNVACGAAQVCREGVCFPGCTECSGVQCTGGLLCAADTGDCFDPSCPEGCPVGTYCDDGDCLDSCDGAICPAGSSCVDGECTDSGGGGGGGGGGGDDDDDSTAGTDSGGCGCARAGPMEPAEALLVLFLLFPRRRRKL